IGKVPEIASAAGPDEIADIQKILVRRHELENAARERGVRVISLGDFLNYIGYAPQAHLFSPGANVRYRFKAGAPPWGPQGDVAFVQPGAFGPHPWGQPGGGGGPAFGPASGGADAEGMLRKAEALFQAAAKLKEAGLEDQAKEIVRQAESTKAWAETVRDHAARFPGGPPGFPAGPIAGELQHSIRELHEQVQLLRKEVAELRDLLRRKP